MSRLDNIYSTFVNTENYEEFPETQEAESQIYEYLKKMKLRKLTLKNTLALLQQQICVRDLYTVFGMPLTF